MVLFANREYFTEKQIEKKKQRQQQQQQGDVDDRWADRFSTYKPAAVPEQVERISSAPSAALPSQQQQPLHQTLPLSDADLENSQTAS